MEVEGLVGWSPDFENAILHAAAAGGCAYWARKEPDAAPGLTRAAQRYRTVAADLVTEWIGTLAATGDGAASAHQQPAPGGGGRLRSE